jgi:hypothetical protein
MAANKMGRAEHPRLERSNSPLCLKMTPNLWKIRKKKKPLSISIRSSEPNLKGTGKS